MSTQPNHNRPQLKKELAETWKDFHPIYKASIIGATGVLAFNMYSAANSDEPIKPETPEQTNCAVSTVAHGSSELEAAGQAYIEAANTKDESVDIHAEDATHIVNNYLQNRVAEGIKSPLHYASKEGAEVAVCLGENGSISSVMPVKPN